MKTLLTTMAVIATTATSALAWDANTTQDELRAQIAEGNNVIMLQELANADPTNADAEILFRENQADYYTSYGREDGYIRDQIASAQRRLDYLVRIAEIPPELRDYQAYQVDAQTIFRRYGEAPIARSGSVPFDELTGYDLTDAIAWAELQDHEHVLTNTADPIERGLRFVALLVQANANAVLAAQYRLPTGHSARNTLDAVQDKLVNERTMINSFIDSYIAARDAWTRVEITLDPATVQQITARTPTD